MKKIYAIIAVLTVVAAFITVAGCQKQEAPKPAVQSATTSTAAASAPTATAPAAK